MAAQVKISAICPQDFIVAMRWIPLLTNVFLLLILPGEDLEWAHLVQVPIAEPYRAEFILMMIPTVYSAEVTMA